MKLPDKLEARLTAVAYETGVTKPSVVREALAEYLVREPPAGEASFAALARDLAGSVEGPEDLSSNRERLGAYGE